MASFWDAAASSALQHLPFIPELTNLSAAHLCVTINLSAYPYYVEISACFCMTSPFVAPSVSV